MKKPTIQQQVRSLIGEKKEVPYVDRKPYSHNIITVTLRIVAQKVGTTYANALIDEFKLERLG